MYRSLGWAYEYGTYFGDLVFILNWMLVENVPISPLIMPPAQAHQTRRRPPVGPQHKQTLSRPDLSLLPKSF